MKCGHDHPNMHVLFSAFKKRDIYISPSLMGTDSALSPSFQKCLRSRHRRKFDFPSTMSMIPLYINWAVSIGPAITFFSSMRSVFFISRYVPRNLSTESAVPEEATQQGKVSGQESNGVFSVILSALNSSSLRRISPSPSP